MEPFYFESGEEKLFGVYHPAKDVFSRKAILVCAPLYAEYYRTYRYIRKLSDAWAQAGYHVLRFDYYGTGDSEGDWKEGGPGRWQRDIVAAASELIEISGCDEIIPFGVRFGASLATLALPSIGDVRRMVVLDPIVDGQLYLQALEQTHVRLLEKSNERTRRNLSELTSELAGFSREPWVSDELPLIDLKSHASGDLNKLIYVASDEAYMDRGMIDKLKSLGVDVEEKLCVDDCDWGTPSESAIQAFNVFEGLRQCL